ncbi:MAG: Phage gp6-like head-tail connector protein [Pelotomaculum sp. PtaB.Bin104]|nr:MAG: Phage gp6-like head-tail connector protein [Pelotomaculum sp. PtaB.Bin104]
MALKIKTQPASEPISLAEAKSHLRVDGTDEDTFIDGLISAAREDCEDFQSRAYITQTWELWLDNWPGSDCIDIPLPPLQSITSIKYYDTDGTEYTMATVDYFVDTKSYVGRVVLAYGKAWPSTTLRPANGVCIEFVAGYGDAAADLPAAVKQAMLLIIGDLYENRENTVIGKQTNELPMAAKSLLWKNRVVPV